MPKNGGLNPLVLFLKEEIQGAYKPGEQKKVEAELVGQARPDPSK